MLSKAATALKNVSTRFGMNCDTRKYDGRSAYFSSRGVVPGTLTGRRGSSLNVTIMAPR
jgi:hypothetical protein